MMLKKNRTISKIPRGIVLNCDDRKKFADFIILLATINNHINARDCIDNTNKKAVKKVKQKGSLNPPSPRLRRTGCGPFQLSSGQACFLSNNSLSLKTMKHITFIVSRSYALQQDIGNN